MSITRITRTNDHGFVNGCARVANLFADSLTIMSGDHGESADQASGMSREEAQAIWDAGRNRRGRRTAAELAAKAILTGEAQTDSRSFVGASLVSEADVEAAEILRSSALTLARKAGTLARLIERTGDERAVEALDTLADTAAVTLARLFTLNRDAFQIWDGGPQHMPGIEAALRHNHATAWTTSRKGYDATGRDVKGVSNNKAHRSTIAAIVTASEAAIEEEVAAA